MLNQIATTDLGMALWGAMVATLLMAIIMTTVEAWTRWEEYRDE